MSEGNNILHFASRFRLIVCIICAPLELEFWTRSLDRKLSSNTTPTVEQQVGLRYIMINYKSYKNYTKTILPTSEKITGKRLIN